MATPINPDEIPGHNLKPDEVDIAASQMRLIGNDVASQGGTILASWQGISAHYEAPESGTLFSVMDPVATKADLFGTNVGTVAQALYDFAEEIRPIKAELDRIRSEAIQLNATIDAGVEKTVHSRYGSHTTTIDWEEDDDLRDQNNDLLSQVNAQMVLLWAAERTCANKIYDIIGHPHIEAATDSNPNGYGVTEIPEDAEMPWGSKVDEPESCGEQAVGAVKGFVWDGVIVGGIWGTVQGLGSLVLGYNPATGEWLQGDVYGAAWSNLGMLGVGLATSSLPGGTIMTNTMPGPVGDFLRDGQDAVINAGKGMIAWDQWSEDPAAAAGTAVFNVGTILIPAGAAVSAVKTGAGAGAAALRTAATVVDFVDPAALAVRGGSSALRATMPALSSVIRTFDFSGLSDLGNIGSRVDVPRVEVPTVPSGGYNFDVPSGSSHVPEPRPAVVLDAPPVREPAMAGNGHPVQQPGSTVTSPSGSTAVDAPPVGTTTSGGGSTVDTGGSGTGGSPVDTRPTGGGAADPATPSATDGGTSGAPNDPAGPGGPAGPDGPPSPGSAVDDGRPWSPDDGDPALSDADYGPGWDRDTGTRGNPVDPEYGQPRADHGTLADDYAPPSTIPEPIRHLVEDPAAPYGRDAANQPYTRQEWEQRYIGPDNRPIYPGNDGAVPGRRVDFTDVDEFLANYGPLVDRMGGDGGSFLSFPETAFEARALPGSNLNAPYSVLELTGRMPDGVRIEVSEVAPAFGQPGGGLQVRFIDDATGTPLSVTDMLSERFGILERVDVDTVATPHFSDGVHGLADDANQSVSSAYSPPHVGNTLEVPAPGPRTPFAGRLDLEPNTAYNVEGRGTFYTGPDGRVNFVETSYGGNGSLNPDLINPSPDTTYVVNGHHVFETDAQSRTVAVHVEDLTIEDAYRSDSIQSRIGNEGGEGYDGGHLVGNATGGGAEDLNVVAMLESVNRGSGHSYFNLENKLRSLISGDPPAQVDLHIYPEYGPDGRVPTSFSVEYSIDGVEQPLVQFTNVRP